MILSFSVWATSLSMTISRSIHVGANGIISFFFMAEYYFILYICHIFFIHFSLNGHLSCFHVLTITNSIAMNIGVNESFQTIVFSRYMLRSGITGSYDHSWNMVTHMISHEIRRPFLLGRKAMTNLDSVLKSRGMALQTKVCLVKAVVFPVVMYGCDSRTVKKAEHQRIDAFELWCWEDSWKSLGQQGDQISQS